MGLLEKEGEEKGSSFWDWIIGIGLVLVIGGFTVYYQYQKRSSISHGKQADSLYTAGKFAEAEKVYEELKHAQYLTPQDDSTIYARLDTIETAKEVEAAKVAEAKAKLQAGDTSGATGIVGGLRHRDLLNSEDEAWISSALAGKAPGTSTP